MCDHSYPMDRFVDAHRDCFLISEREVGLTTDAGTVHIERRSPNHEQYNIRWPHTSMLGLLYAPTAMPSRLYPAVNSPVRWCIEAVEGLDEMLDVLQAVANFTIDNKNKTC